MPVQRFVTKRVEIDAVQFTGDNFIELEKWTDQKFSEAADDQKENGITAHVYDVLHSTWIGVKPGQWIVRGAVGEFYPCDNETFHWKYEEVKPDENGITIRDKTTGEIKAYLGEHIMTADNIRGLEK